MREKINHMHEMKLETKFDWKIKYGAYMRVGVFCVLIFYRVLACDAFPLCANKDRRLQLCTNFW